MCIPVLGPHEMPGRWHWWHASGLPNGDERCAYSLLWFSSLNNRVYHGLYIYIKMVYHDLMGYEWVLPSGKLTVRPWHFFGVGRLVSIENWSFSGSMFIYHRVYNYIKMLKTIHGTTRSVCCLILFEKKKCLPSTPIGFSTMSYDKSNKGRRTPYKNQWCFVIFSSPYDHSLW